MRVCEHSPAPCPVPGEPHWLCGCTDKLQAAEEGICRAFYANNHDIRRSGADTLPGVRPGRV